MVKCRHLAQKRLTPDNIGLHCSCMRFLLQLTIVLDIMLNWSWKYRYLKSFDNLYTSVKLSIFIKLLRHENLYVGPLGTWDYPYWIVLLNFDNICHNLLKILISYDILDPDRKDFKAEKCGSVKQIYLNKWHLCV